MRDPTVSKRELLIFLYKYRLRLILAFAIPFLLSVMISFLPTPRYVANSTLIVRLGAEYVYSPEVTENQNGSNNLIPFNTSQIFKSEVAILSSEDLHADVIKSFGINELFPESAGIFSEIHEEIAVLSGIPREEIEREKLARAVELFDKRFDILLEKDSAVIKLAFEHRNADLAAKTLDTLLKLYLEKRKNVYLEPRTALATTEKNASYKHMLSAERTVQEYKRQHKIHSFSDEREQLLERRDKAEEQSSVISNSGLERKIDDYNHKLEKLDSLERDFNLLQKEAQVARDSYALYSRKYDEAQAFEDLEHDRLDSVRIIQSPTVAAEPKRLQFWIILGGVFLSVMVVFIVAAVTELLKNGFHTPEQIEQAIRMPVLAVFDKSLARMEDNINRLMHSQIEKNGHIVTFISAREGEGASDIAWNYARKLANETDSKVLLMNATMLPAGHYRQHGVALQSGIVDEIVAGNMLEAAIQEVSGRLSACTFVHDEDKRNKAGQIINDDEFWKNLSAMFDNIVVDAGSLNASFISVALAAKSSAVIMVIEAEKTPRLVVNNLADTLQAAGASVAGVVMNGRKRYIPEKIYKRI